MSGILMAAAGGAVNITLTTDTISDSQSNPLQAGAGLKMLRTGAQQRNIIHGISPTNYSDINGSSWVLPRSSTVGDAYHVKITLNSGTSPSGSAVGSWLALTSDREWYHDRASDGTTTCNLTLAISRDGGSTTITSVTIVLTATRTP